MVRDKTETDHEYHSVVQFPFLKHQENLSLPKTPDLPLYVR